MSATTSNLLRSNISTMQRAFKVALIQMSVVPDLNKNLENAENLIKRAKQTEPSTKLVCLPECFNSPYGTKYFQEYAETASGGPTTATLSKMAKSNSVHLIGGTFPESESGNYYNTCTVWNPQGEMVAKYRKMHLFDIDIPGGITFKESDILHAGNTPMTFDLDGTKVGLGICYDLRFEELAKIYRIMGCEMLVYPGAFNMTTGPIHWELLQRGRAVDNQVYVFAVSPARSDKGYIAWGHSQATDPWGKVVAKASYGEEILFCDVDLEECNKVRQQIPIFAQRRTDVYNTVLVGNALTEVQGS